MYFIIHSGTGYFKEEYRERYLIFDSTDKFKEVWSGIRSGIKTINSGKELFYEENYARIGINTDDDLPLNKSLKFPTLTIIIRYVFQKDEKLYPQIYLDECLDEKMLQYDRIDVSEGIDMNKTSESKECMLCHYWYFEDVGYKFQPYLCNGCHAVSMIKKHCNIKCKRCWL